MKRYTVSQARERLAEVLDEAEQGGTPVIERRDVQYVITAKRTTKTVKAGKSAIEVLDPAIETGEWHWTWSPKGLQFAGRKRRS